jgi:hypothetical protein
MLVAESYTSLSRFVRGAGEDRNRERISRKSFYDLAKT